MEHIHWGVQGINVLFKTVLMVNGCPLHILCCAAAARRAKFRTKCPNTLLKPKNNLTSVKFVGGWSKCIKYVVCDELSMCLRFMT